LRWFSLLAFNEDGVGSGFGVDLLGGAGDFVGDIMGVEESAGGFGADSEVDILGHIARNPCGADGV